MDDMYKTKNKLGIKDHSAGPWMDGVSKHAMNADGTVGYVAKCGHWDWETDNFGFCRDEDCKRERFIEALYKGEAMMTKEGVIVWCPGICIAKRAK